MSHYSGTVIESQPDWLTVSAHGEAKARLLLELGVRLAKEEQARGNRPGKHLRLGYEGIHVGRVTYGQRDLRATQLMLSGDLAASELDVSVALADSVTRLDLAVTCRLDQPSEHLGDEAAHEAIGFRKLHPAKARPWAIFDGDAINTLYLGERGSEYFFRLYNKERQERKEMGASYDGRYDNCWRYELETKASVPSLILKKLLPERDRGEWIRSYLHAYTLAHGLEPPFDVAGPLALIPGFRRKSDVDSKLNHLSRNVRPTVKWLREQGRDADMRQALGLAGSKETLTLGGIPVRHTLSYGVGRSTQEGANGKGSVVRQQEAADGERSE